MRGLSSEALPVMSLHGCCIYTSFHLGWPGEKPVFHEEQTCIFKAPWKIAFVSVPKFLIPNNWAVRITSFRLIPNYIVQRISYLLLPL